MLYKSDLDLVLQEIMLRWGVPGLAVGIVEGDEIVYAKGFGVQSLETQAPVTLDSVFIMPLRSGCCREFSKQPPTQPRRTGYPAGTTQATTATAARQIASR